MFWFVLYCAFLFFICVFRHGICGTTAEFYVCDRKAGSGEVAFSMLASSIGGSATLGMIGLAWQAGLPAFWWLGSGVAGLLLLGWLLARKIRSSRAHTMPELCEKQFGPLFRKLCATIIAAACVPIVAAQFSAQSIIISSLTGIDFNLSLLAGAFALFSCTWTGGQNAVIKSDVWQFMILPGTLLLIFPYCLSNPDCRSALAAAPIVAINEKFPLSRLIYFMLILGSTFVAGPMLHGRLLSARSQRGALKACFLPAGGLFLMALLITSIGIALQGIIPAHTLPLDYNAQDILGVFINSRLPQWAVPICLLGLFSAIISSADSCLFTAASVCANDFLKKPATGACRLAMLAITLLSLLLSLQGKGILNLLLMANDIYVCGVVPPVFLELVYKAGISRSHGLLICGMTRGGSLGAIASWLQMPALSIYGVFFSFFVCLLSIEWQRVKYYFVRSSGN